MNSNKYEKFKNNNLPTPFWNEERQILEYVYYEKSKNQGKTLTVSTNLAECLGDISLIGLYFPFTYTIKIDHFIEKTINGHAHFFNDVLKVLYDYPESFKIMKNDESYYSAQELEFIKRVQEYLLQLGLKDLRKTKFARSRYKSCKRK